MDWIKERWRTASQAIGIRRFAIGSVVLGAVAILNWLAAEVAMSWLSGIPNRAVAVAVPLVLVAWWLLEYANKLRKEAEP